MRPDRGAILRPVAVFALSGLAVLALVAVGGTLALRSLSTSEAVRDARRLATVTGRGIVEPALTTAVVRGDPQAIARLDRIVHRRVLASDVARVKIWNAEGKILYSDDASLIGRRYTLAPEDLRALRTSTASARQTDLTEPENAHERSFGKLTSVYLGLRAQDGTPVLYEEYLRSSAIAGSSRRLVRLFAPVGIGALLVLAVLQIPLAWRMAHRIRRAQQDRERLLQSAIDASDRERRLIAAGLHDGVVQEFAGHSFEMAAAAEQDQSNAELRRVLGALHAAACAPAFRIASCAARNTSCSISSGICSSSSISSEREVLALVAEGLPNKQIGRRLEISEKTVKAHLTSVFRAIGVTDRMQAGLWARRHGL